MLLLYTRPLIDALKCDNSTKQIWYADDATAAGSISALKQWWQRLLEIGPSFGYYANASKTWLVTKERYLSLAQESFKDTEVNITTEGRPLLGAAIGKISFDSEYVTQKVQTWVKELERLSSIAESQPHAAYASLTHGLSSKWSYLSRTVPNISHLLQSLADTLKSKLIPQLTGKEPPNDLERDLLALPARLGGMGIRNPVQSAQNEFQASKDITKSLSDQISQQNANYSFEVLEKQLSAKARVKSQRRLSLKAKADNLRESLPSSLQLAMDLSKEKGASNWLTVLYTN